MGARFACRWADRSDVHKLRPRFEEHRELTPRPPRNQSDLPLCHARRVAYGQRMAGGRRPISLITWPETTSITVTCQRAQLVAA